MINYDQLELICRLATILNRCEPEVTVQNLMVWVRTDGAYKLLSHRSGFTMNEARVELEMLRRALESCNREEGVV